MEGIQLPNDIYEIIPSINILNIILYIFLGILIVILIYCMFKYISTRFRKQELKVISKEDRIRSAIEYIKNLDTNSLDDKTFYQKLSFTFRYILELYFNFPATNYTYLELKPHINNSFFDTKLRSNVLSFFSTVDSIMFNPSFIVNSEDKKTFKDNVLSWSELIEQKLIEDKKLEELNNKNKENNHLENNRG